MKKLLKVIDRNYVEHTRTTAAAYTHVLVRRDEKNFQYVTWHTSRDLARKAESRALSQEWSTEIIEVGSSLEELPREIVDAMTAEEFVDYMFGEIPQSVLDRMAA